jgi:hypothetical protein
VYDILLYISEISVLIPLCCFLRIKTYNPTLKVLLAILIVATITEVLSYYFSYYKKNLFYLTQNVYTIIESLLLAILYYFESKSGTRYWFIVLFSGLILIISLYLVLAGKITSLDNLLIVTESLTMIGFSFSFFFQIVNQLDIPRKTEYPLFWINSSVLLYFMTTLIYFLSRDYFLKISMEAFMKAEAYNSITNILHYCLFAVAIWKYKQI